MKKQIENEKLRLIVFQSAKELGNKVDRHLLARYGLDSDKYTLYSLIDKYFDSDINIIVKCKKAYIDNDLVRDILYNFIIKNFNNLRQNFL